MIINANANDVSGTHMELLWSSGSIDSYMNKETVTINMYGYEALYIQFIVISGTLMFCSEIVPIDLSLDCSFLAEHNHNKILYSRGFKITTDGIEFATSSEKNLSNGEILFPTNNHMVPYRIYGIR